MKNKTIKIIVSLFSVMLVLLVANSVNAATTVNNGGTVSLQVGQSMEITYGRYGAAASYKPNNSKIATVSNQNNKVIVKGISAGKTSVVVGVRGIQEGSFTVNVTAATSSSGSTESSNITDADRLELKRWNDAEQVWQNCVKSNGVISVPNNARDMAYFVRADFANHNGEGIAKMAKTQNGLKSLQQYYEVFVQKAKEQPNTWYPDARNELATLLNKINGSVANGASTSTAIDSAVSDVSTEVEEKKNVTLKKFATVSGESRQSTPFYDVFQDPSRYNPTDQTDKAPEVAKAVSTVMGVVQTIGIVTAIIVSAVLGIKYIIGSMEERAQYKENLVPYILGIVILVGVPTIVRILYNFGMNVNNT